MVNFKPLQLVGVLAIALVLAGTVWWVQEGRPTPSASVTEKAPVTVPGKTRQPRILEWARATLKQAGGGPLAATVQLRGTALDVERRGRHGVLCRRSECALVRQGQERITVTRGQRARARLWQLARSER